MNNFLNFHKQLNQAILLWAESVDALLNADTPQTIKLGLALLDLQPEALYVDTVRDLIYREV